MPLKQIPTFLRIQERPNKIWKTFKEQTKKGSVRVNYKRAKLEPEKGGLGIIDIPQFWMG